MPPGGKFVKYNESQNQRINDILHLPESDARNQIIADIARERGCPTELIRQRMCQLRYAEKMAVRTPGMQLVKVKKTLNVHPATVMTNEGQLRLKITSYNVDLNNMELILNYKQ